MRLKVATAVTENTAVFLDVMPREPDDGTFIASLYTYNSIALSPQANYND
jgi:hypothetical protein